jgi:hypothetical protein
VDSITNFFVSKKYSTTLNYETASLIDSIVAQDFIIMNRELKMIRKNVPYGNAEISQFNQYGWDYSETDRCWGLGLESKIAFMLNGEMFSQLIISSIVLDSSKNGFLHLKINNDFQITKSFRNETIVDMPLISIYELEMTVTFSDIEKTEESADKRLITFSLQSLTLKE